MNKQTAAATLLTVYTNGYITSSISGERMLLHPTCSCQIPPTPGDQPHLSIPVSAAIENVRRISDNLDT